MNDPAAAAARCGCSATARPGAAWTSSTDETAVEMEITQDAGAEDAITAYITQDMNLVASTTDENSNTDLTTYTTIAYA